MLLADRVVLEVAVRGGDRADVAVHELAELGAGLAAGEERGERDRPIIRDPIPRDEPPVDPPPSRPERDGPVVVYTGDILITIEGDVDGESLLAQMEAAVAQRRAVGGSVDLDSSRIAGY